MEEEYWQAIHKLETLNQFTGYLDTEGLKERVEAKSLYRREIMDLSHRLIASSDTPGAAMEIATDSLLGILRTNLEWREVIAQVKDDLVAQIDADSRTRPFIRWARYYSLPILAALGVAIYFTVWWYNQITIDKPASTLEGLRERAMAFDKVIKYEEDSSSSGIRGGMARSLILSVMEPNEQEIAAAKQFVSTTLAAYQATPASKRTCILADPNTGEITEEAGRTYLKAVSEQLLAQPAQSRSGANEALNAAIKSVPGCGEAWRKP